MKTEKKRAFLINFAYFGVMVALAFFGIRYLLPIILPFVIAFIIAYFLQWPVNVLEKRFGLPHKPIAILAVLLFYVIVGGVLTLMGAKIVSAVINLVKEVPSFYIRQIYPFFVDILHDLERVLIKLGLSELGAASGSTGQVIQSLSEMVSGLPGKVVDVATGFAVSVPGLFVDIVIMIICTFFITIDYRRLTDFCMRQLDDNSKKLFLEIKEYVVGTLLVCIGSYALIMSITFVELSVAFTLIGMNHAIIVAACIAVFDILPVLGTGGIMIPWAVFMLVYGNYPLALELFLIYVIITVIRNIIEPKIIGGQLGLHPVVTLICMFVGVEFFGVIGLFGLPILLSLILHLNAHGAINVLK
ncbi:MAG: sporulation integral membrane protein YtvI [Lachnospiraceae bacterium]|nr:sporulation integral membrane protein YtvI [Lachnospiraceae bacterium]